ncbi:MAG: aryl-alcohol dehydrogenase-like predicted oxidoreductase [Cyclobacteriaceae bacterium]|jgi:aryl-alcohol dehydrogenase-like predicted oxidoreductase
MEYYCIEHSIFKTEPLKTEEVKYRRLGKTNLNVSEISLGTWQVGGGWGKAFNEKTASAIIETALGLGVNFLDTADVYDGQLSERKVGKYVKAKRDQLYIATKIGRRINPHIAEGYTAEIIEKYIDEALINTGLGYLDLVQLHCPPSAVYHKDEIFKKLEEIKARGKVRHFGVSVEKIDEAIKATDYDVIETVQIIFNMFRQRPIDDCFEILKSRDIGIIVRVPLASGLLSGKMTSVRKFDKDDHRNFNKNGEIFDKGETFSGVPLDDGFKAVEDIKMLFQTEELFRAALKWILMFKEVSTVIPGASKPDQVISNIDSIKWPELSDLEMKSVKEIYDSHISKHVHQSW